MHGGRLDEFEKELGGEDWAKDVHSIGSLWYRGVGVGTIGTNTGLKTTPKFRMLPMLHSQKKVHKRIRNFLEEDGFRDSIFDAGKREGVELSQKFGSFGLRVSGNGERGRCQCKSKCLRSPPPTLIQSRTQKLPAQ